MNSVKVLMVVSIMLALTACGGGGGGSSQTASSAVTLPTIKVDTNNASNLATESQSNSQQSSSIAQTSGALTAAQSTTVAASVPNLQLHAINQQINNTIGKINPSTAAQGASGSQLCYYGGTWTYSGSVASSSSFTAGDNIKLTYNNCKDSSSTTITGSASLQITAGPRSLNSTSYQYTTVLSYEAFKFSGNYLGTTYSYAVDGSATISFDTKKSPAESHMTGKVLTLTMTSGSSTNAVSIKEFDQTIKTSGSSTSIQSKADFHSTYLNASYHLETTSPMVLNTNSGVIQTGVYTVTGDNNTWLKYSKTDPAVAASITWQDASGITHTIQ